MIKFDIMKTMKFLKSIILFTILCTGILFVSCQSTDEHTGNNDNKSDLYAGKAFVGTWKATVEDGEVYYLKLNADASFAERYSSWSNFYDDYDHYTVNGNRITLPNCGFAQGYGETFTMEIVNNNKMVWIGDLLDCRVELIRQ